MYIPEFLAGVGTVIICELLAIIAAAIILHNKEDKK